MSIKWKGRENKPKRNPGCWYGAIWALMSAIVAFVFLFLAANGFSEIRNISADTAEVFAYLVYDLMIAVACYFITRRYPGSVFVVPVLANIMGIISSVIEPNFWNSSIWVLIVCGWILSIMTSLAGYIVNTRID